MRMLFVSAAFRVKTMLFSLLFISLTLACVFSTCSNLVGDKTPDAVSSRSYKGHQSTADADNFVKAYPDAVGTRLDDCILCHTSGIKSGSTTVLNACDYCHYVKVSGLPYSASLNPYGIAYKANGRSKEAVLAIRSMDSDSDSYTNDQEIAQRYFPGNTLSTPGKAACPFKTVSMDTIRHLTAHTQFLLSNTSKQQFDDYATYTGVTISDLLTGLGIDTTGITGITVFAPDGFAKSFSMAKAVQEYPKSVFYAGLDDAGLGQRMGFVNYPDTTLHSGLKNGDTIPDSQRMLLAYQRDFADMSMSYIDTLDWRIQGEGPFRLVRPQDPASMPDRGSTYPKSDQYDYKNTYDHNAGDNVRGVSIIRLDPMPAQYEEYDALNGGWSIVEAKKIVIYGHGITK